MVLGFILGCFFTFMFLFIPAVLNAIPKEYEYEKYYYEESYRDIKGNGKFNNEIWKNKDKEEYR
jgi:hypothetical protein